MLSKFVAFCLLISAAFSSAHSQSSQAAASPFDGAPFSMSAVAIREASRTVSSDKLSDATILFEQTNYKFAENGALTYTHRLVYRIETQKGVENWAEISLEWDPWFEKPSQLHARVLQNNDEFVELDQKTITDGPVDSDEDETYTQARERKAPLPGLAVGSIVEEVISVEDKKPYFGAGQVYSYYFTNNAPVEQEEVIVDIPSSMPFQDQHINLPQLVVSRTERGGIRHVVYSQSHEAATISGDINLPSTENPVPLLQFSTGSSWAGIARGYMALSEPQIRPDQVHALIATAANESRLARIEQIVHQLHKEVRYTGIEFGEAELVPQEPSVVLSRHYGDCKDKAALLVSMLRASGIPANLALLSAGTGRDVNPELPGMNRFNHAIVYLPASGSDPALWIDATAEYNKVGTLPYEDSDRMALVISANTTQLTRTPAPKPEDSILIETRTFKLAELGPAQVVEDSATQGYVDARYRARYGSATTKNIHDDLESYSQSAYLAKGLTQITHGEGSDFSKPFHLTLTIEGARRGFSSLSDSAVAMFPSGLLNQLPEWVRTAPKPLLDTATPEQKQERAQQEAHRSPTYHIEPFIYEQRYVITAPSGFTIHALPPDATTVLGPATLTERYVQDSPTVVRATLRFTTGKSIFTTRQALDLRDAVVKMEKRPFVEVSFDEKGVKLMQEGKVKEALASDEAAVAADPKSPLPHVRLARALLTAGVGDMARDEAAKAVALDPESAAALLTQGWVLEHNSLGKRFGPGFDRQGAIAAFRKAIPLHSEDFDPRFDLAVLYEFDGNGARYSATADLDKAIDIYRDLIDSEKEKNSSDIDQNRLNLGFALLFAHRYSELDKLLPDISPGATHATLAITSAVASKDVAAGIAVADRENLSAADRSRALTGAGNNLAELGLYPQAADILTAGIQGQNDAPDLARRIDIYRKLKRVPSHLPPVTSPESLVRRALDLGMVGVPNKQTLASMMTIHAYASQADFDRDVDKGEQESGFLQMLATKTGLSQTVLRDMVVGTMEVKTTGDDATGYRLLCQSLGQTQHMFVVKEDGSYRLLSDGSEGDNAQIGHYVLYALEHHNLALAKSILDWKRDLVHKGGGDDPLQGPLMPRFWTVGSVRESADSPESMRVAAISLMVGQMNLKPYLDELIPLRDRATGAHQEDFDLLLARGYVGSEQAKSAVVYTSKLLQEEPDSITAVALDGTAFELEGNITDWAELLDTRLKQKPNDPDLLRQHVRLLTARHDYAGAQEDEKLVIDSGQGNDNDYNSYAWLGLFDNHLGPDTTDATQKADVLSKSASFGILHTTACIYAAQGKVVEAQQVLDQAMQAGNLAKPNSAVWYALGLLYEDYGLKDAALTAYRRVNSHDFDNHTFVDAESTYLLAQKGIVRIEDHRN